VLPFAREYREFPVFSLLAGNLAFSETVNRCWQMPRSYEELVQRRKALQAWAHLSYGFLGRSPDHVASAVIGQRRD
jgi:aromatic ring hydroxylase